MYMSVLLIGVFFYVVDMFIIQYKVYLIVNILGGKGFSNDKKKIYNIQIQICNILFKYLIELIK